MTTATELRRWLIESGPWADLGQAVSVERTERDRHGLQDYYTHLDGAIWPNPLSIYWAIPPYHQHRPPITGENEMTDKKTQEAEDATVPALVTNWANSLTPESFDHDQAAVHRWMEASDEERLHALETQMTLADAEELAATARALSSEHSRRAQRARDLVTIIAARLGREADALKASETTKAVPAQHPQGAREATPTRAMPTQPRPASSPTSLPSAL